VEGIRVLDASGVRVGGAKQVLIETLKNLRALDSKVILVVHESLRNEIESHVFADVVLETVYFDNNFLLNLRVLKLLANHSKLSWFTLFGPGKCAFPFNRLTGFADGWCYGDLSTLKSKISRVEKTKIRIRCVIKLLILSLISKSIIVETDDARLRLKSFVLFKKKPVFIVPNAIPSVSCKIANKPAERNNYRIGYLSAKYIHKNHELLNEIVPDLRRLKCQFFVTLANSEYNDLFKGKEDIIINAGVVGVKDLDKFYLNIDAIAHLSLLETFSVSYLEAFCFGKPVIATDFEFAREICGSSALYFNPSRPKELVDLIEKLKTNKKLQLARVNSGFEGLDKHIYSIDRTKKYLSLWQ